MFKETRLHLETNMTIILDSMVTKSKEKGGGDLYDHLMSSVKYLQFDNESNIHIISKK